MTTLRDSIRKRIVFNILNDRGEGDLRRVQFSRVSWMKELQGKGFMCSTGTTCGTSCAIRKMTVAPARRFSHAKAGRVLRRTADAAAGRD